MPGTILFGIDVETASEDAVAFAERGQELFHELNVPVTWYLTGRTLERYPDVFRAIDGDDLIELQAHTYSHVLLKTVLIRIPEGKTIHGSTDWYMERGSSLETIESDLGRCQAVFQNVLGRRANAMTGPWCYYRGLGDRPDLLEMVHRHGFNVLRTFGRDEDDGQPVPLEWQPFFYKAQGFPAVLEIMVHGYQDDFYWSAFTGEKDPRKYVEHLKSFADKAAKEDLTWSLCSHDHRCATEEGFQNKAQWYRAVIGHALRLGVRFLPVTQYYNEKIVERDTSWGEGE